MSAVTDQTNCELLMIKALSLQADLSALYSNGGIVNGDATAQISATNKNYISVTAENREGVAYGKNMATVVLWKCVVKVEVHMTENNPALLDAYMAAIEAANVGTCPAAVVTLATSLFGSRGFDWYDTEDGERTNTPNERARSKSWEARFGA